MWTFLQKINDAIDDFFNVKKEQADAEPQVAEHKWSIKSEEDRQKIIRFVEQPGVAEKYGITPEEIQALKELNNDMPVGEFHQKVKEMEYHSNNNTVKVEEPEDDGTLDDVLYELHNLIGLDDVKEEVKTLINFIKIQKAREENKLKPTPISYHCVFTGSPGTGKTTIARMIARIYKHLGVIEKGHLVETDRSGLVAEYAGQTATKVDKVVQQALGGVLFIDEAYSLVGKNDDYGKEAVAALIKRMEDHRENLVVIVAGYPKEMEEFIDTNPGFKSRFNRYIEFKDYNPEELVNIYKMFCGKGEYEMTPEAEKALTELFEQLYKEKDKNFGNGRLVRNIFEKTIENHSNRIVGVGELTKELLTTIELHDIPLGNEEV